MKKADELKCLYRTRESLAASVQWACVLSVNGPNIPCSGSLQGWGLMETGKSLAVTLIRICWAGNIAGKDRTSFGISEPVSHPLPSWFVMFYSPVQAAPVSYSHLSPHNNLLQPLEKPRFRAGCSPGKIPVPAEPKFLTPEQFQNVCLQEGCHLPACTKPSSTGMVQTGCSWGLTWRRKHKSIPSASYITVFQYTRLEWSCFRVNITLSSQSSSLKTLIIKMTQNCVCPCPNKGMCRTHGWKTDSVELKKKSQPLAQRW